MGIKRKRKGSIIHCELIETWILIYHHHFTLYISFVLIKDGSEIWKSCMVDTVVSVFGGLGLSYELNLIEEAASV